MRLYFGLMSYIVFCVLDIFLVSTTAAVLAVLAGNDLLCATDYAVQYQAVLQAVLDGRIDMVTLDNAVKAVLKWKMELALF